MSDHYFEVNEMNEEQYNAEKHDENTVQYWKEVKSTQRKNLKNEEEKIEQMKEAEKMLEKKRKRDEENMALQLEESELMRKLYREHGEDYVNTEDWKLYVDKRLAFKIRTITEDIKNFEQHHSLQLKQIQKSKSESDEWIKKYKGFIKEANNKIKEIEKTKKSYMG